MLSFLIPTYNYNVYPLALQIEKQAINAKIKFELICIDDGSISSINKENEKINSLTNCKFIEAKENVGLSHNRNTLAKLANYKYILFIDGDSLLTNDTFILNYLKALQKNTDVIYGGRIHPKSTSSERKLRWKYGINKEDVSASNRKNQKYKCILFNNTLIKKRVFEKIEFENSITQYGHEDTLFAYNLSKIKATVLHIDNPVLHNDIDLSHVFINKTLKSIENLNVLYQSNMIDTNFVTFLKVFNSIKTLKLNYVFAYSHYILSPLYKIQLTSKYPSILILNILKMSYFCKINLKK